MAKRTPAPGAAASGKRTKIKVRALEMGYYGDILRRPGDVFVLDHEDHLAHWTEEVDPATPEKVTSHGEALKQHRDDTRAATENGGLTRDDVTDEEAASDPLGD